MEVRCGAWSVRGAWVAPRRTTVTCGLKTLISTSHPRLGALRAAYGANRHPASADTRRWSIATELDPDALTRPAGVSYDSTLEGVETKGLSRG